MNNQTEELIKKIVSGIRYLVRAVYSDASKMSKQFGLTGPQHMVLRNLYQQGQMSSAQLSRKLHVTPSNITGIIDRLESKGLVTRIQKKGDRRVHLISLTPSGTDLSKNLPDPIERKLISGLANLAPEQVQNLEGSIHQILKLIDVQTGNDYALEFFQVEPLDDEEHSTP
ncbi:MAG: MarR family transcriptional regulator [Desulfobacterales bacterium]|jgi:DNA-binding MarR family transcriptional regulator|nr:MarR family transcriptional regulator [Desulfobacterales bacterium]MDD3081493.1 MarR family transcriptional regulator [Desulfobacterales bacterium]MDD3950432.1 MarR family transcriptional regulator [Desulfobacterales bacterium]MDD4462956.1 MarR family transcriptional regulator [Desulfobacterales bacterium]MDY0377811.1 MarR family transcriptional regulator [Desulfobacterales bacterium]